VPSRESSSKKNNAAQALEVDVLKQKKNACRRSG
jgi:hypothetical protein